MKRAARKRAVGGPLFLWSIKNYPYSPISRRSITGFVVVQLCSVHRAYIRARGKRCKVPMYLSFLANAYNEELNKNGE